MAKHFEIPASELQPLLEVAYHLAQQREQNALSIKELAQTVKEYGITTEDLFEAQRHLQVQKQKKKRYKKQFFFIVAFFTCLIISLLYIYYPRKFAGNIHTTLTTEITEENTPLDQTTIYQLIRHPNIYAVINFDAIVYPHQVRWEIRDPHQRLVAMDHQNLIRSQKLQTLVVSCPLSFANMLGDYSLQIYVDDQLIETQNFRVEYGNLTTILQDENISIEKLTYLKSATEKVYFQIDETLFAHSGTLEWRWVNENGVVQKHTMQQVIAGIPWQFSESFDIGNKPEGKYQVQLCFRNAKIAERNFEVFD